LAKNSGGLQYHAATLELSKPLIFLSAADDRFARLTSKSRQRDNAHRGRSEGALPRGKAIRKGLGAKIDEGLHGGKPCQSPWLRNGRSGFRFTLEAHKMKMSVALGIAVATVLAVPALADSGDGASIRHHHAYRHLHRAVQSQSVPPRPTAQVPPPAPIAIPVAPYPNGQGDEDGLSRHIGDCNKGCIGGNPG
jgi:hypothetical protein